LTHDNKVRVYEYLRVSCKIQPWSKDNYNKLLYSPLALWIWLMKVLKN